MSGMGRPCLEPTPNFDLLADLCLAVDVALMSSPYAGQWGNNSRQQSQHHASIRYA